MHLNEDQPQSTVPFNGSAETSRSWFEVKSLGRASNLGDDGSVANIFDEVWEAILQKDPTTRTPQEWTFFRGVVLVGDVLGGGFFYNVSPAEGEPQDRWVELRNISTAVRELGCVKEADLLLRAAERFEQAASAPRSTWGEYVKAAGPTGWLEKIEGDLASACDHLEEALAAYRDAHLAGARS